MSNNTKDVRSWNRSVDEKGAYKRKDSQFRSWISADGSTEYPAEAGRYHLYVSFACPWAHRTLIVRALKGLEDVITVNVVHSHLDGTTGWKFDDSEPGATKEEVFGYNFLKQVYLQVKPDYDGNITVPVLFDKKTKTIVNNESSEIIKMLNSEFQQFCKTEENRKLDLYPAELRDKIEAVNERVYNSINNGVYRCGFAHSQGPYEEAYNELFERLDEVEEILSKQRFLTGNTMTLADIRLFTTLVRFDAVYYVHFKTCKRLIESYPNLSNYTRDIYQSADIKATVNMHHIVNHYFASHNHINPFGIVPPGPKQDFTRPHDRTRFTA